MNTIKKIFDRFRPKSKLVVILGVILALVIIFFGRNDAKKKSQIQTALVERKSLTQTISASGTVTAEEKVDLKFQTSGLLSWVGVKEGDYVKKWQTIAQLDKRELQKTLDKYLRDYSSQRNDFEETWRVTYQGHSPSDALTDTVKRILEKNQWDLDKAVLDVELKDIALKFATLTTPIEGIVTHIDAPIAGINITPATAVFTIAKPEPMIFEAQVDEIDIGKVKTDQKVKISLDAYPDETFPGIINQILFDSIATKGGGTAFKVKVKLPENTDLRFKNGMNGDMEIVINQQENILSVPNAAVFYKNGSPYVKLLEKGKIQERPAKIGLETEQYTQILDGLKENDRVVL
jgi:RND family efflux transporter MFP subunit